MCYHRGKGKAYLSASTYLPFWKGGRKGYRASTGVGNKKKLRTANSPLITQSEGNTGKYSRELPSMELFFGKRVGRKQAACVAGRRGEKKKKESRRSHALFLLREQ